MNVAGAVRAVRGALKAAGTPARATGAKAYLKSDLVFLGADTSAVRRPPGGDGTRCAREVRG